MESNDTIVSVDGDRVFGLIRVKPQRCVTLYGKPTGLNAKIRSSIERFLSARLIYFKLSIKISNA